MTVTPKSLPVLLTDGNSEGVSLVIEAPCKPLFDSEVMDFISALSRKLLSDGSYRAYPDLVALGFWLRAGNLNSLLPDPTESVSNSKMLYRKPLGTVMHICPGNVDTMFVYSWVCSMLMGNNNIVRVPSHITEPQQKLLDGIAEVVQNPEYLSVAERNLIASWSSNSQVSAQISALVQGRVIWGGDQTISTVRNLKSEPGCRDVTFADKISIAVINLDNLSMDDIPTLADLLWKDLESFQQAACSSPKVMAFCGHAPGLKSSLYEALEKLTVHQEQSYATNVNHLVASQLLQAANKGNISMASSRLKIHKIDSLSDRYFDWHPAELFLYEYQTSCLSTLLNQLPEKCQTVSHFGFSDDELRTGVSQLNHRAVDRVVPVGQALNFSENWDGYEVLKQLSRVVEVILR